MMLRKNLALKLFVTVIAASLLVGCNKTRDYKNSSRATGWKMNAKEGGFQYDPKAKEQDIKKVLQQVKNQFGKEHG